MYHVPWSQRRPGHAWTAWPQFVLRSSLIIALLSGLLMTAYLMWRHNDFSVLGNVGLFIVIAFYGFIRGFLFSSLVNSGALLLLALSRRPIPQWRRTLVYSVVALVVFAIIGRAVWISPAPGEEDVAINRLVGLMLIPCGLHFPAILWADWRRNRPAPPDRSGTGAVVTLE